MHLPTFESSLLRDIGDAFLRRHKAISYTAKMALTRERDESRSKMPERFNLELHGGHIRLSVWDDGVIWFGVSIRKPGRNQGWAFQDQFHGTVLDVPPAELVALIEATMALPLGNDPIVGRETLRDLWKVVGPAEV